MAESMKELVERLRKQKEISQQSEKKSAIPPMPQQEEVEDEEDIGYEIEEEEQKKMPQRQVKMANNSSIAEEKQDDLQTAIVNRIAQLQDNGIYRFELLQVLMSIDNSLKKLSGL